MTIMQGDAYSIPFKISCGETVVTPDSVDKVEIVLGSLVKNYPDDVTYDSTDKTFLCPLSQEETFNMKGNIPVQVRCLFSNDEVKGFTGKTIKVLEGHSKEVL